MKLVHLKNELELEKSKILLLFILFVSMGLLSVITQALLPDILKLAGFEQIGGSRETTILDVLVDFWGDSVIYMIILLLIGSTTFSSELEVNKQVYFNLSRPISRRKYFATRTLLRVGSMMLIFFLSSFIVYTIAQIIYDPISLDKFILSNTLISLQIGSFLAIIIVFSTKFNSALTAGLGFLFLIIEVFISLIEPLKWFSPFALSNEWIKIVNGTIGSFDQILVLICLVVWLIVPVILGQKIYQTRDL